MARDMIPHTELLQPADVEGALDLLERHGSTAWVLAGGYDSLDWLKNRDKRPRVLVDLEGLDSLKGIRKRADGGLEIGAMTTLTEIERSAVVREGFGLLADAARAVASPQIRNAGTLGGNLCQDARCWYYRSGLPCYRAGGNVCYADTPVAMNREHAILGTDRCVAVTPSDTAPALVALGAEIVIRSPDGGRTVPAGDFFMDPGTDITRMTVLRPRELVTAVRIPSGWRGSVQRFEKVADRKSWDFALVSLSAAFELEGDRIRDVRLVAGAVACVPWRLRRVEGLLRSRTPDPSLAEEAGALAVREARPLNYNGYKVPLLENLVKRAVRAARRV